MGPRNRGLHAGVALPMNTHPKASHHLASAFSLAELLVVLAILAALVGIFMGSAVPRIRLAKRSSCLANLRSWGVATALHATDNADLLPLDGAPNGISVRDAWYVDLPPQIGLPPYHLAGPWRTNSTFILPKSPWICPSNPRRSNGRMLFHYSLNRKATGQGSSDRHRMLSSIPEPSSLVWLFDNGGLAAVAAEGNAHPLIHGAGGQFLFLDGHVQRVTNTAYWDMVRNRPRRDPQGIRWSQNP